LYTHCTRIYGWFLCTYIKTYMTTVNTGSYKMLCLTWHIPADTTLFPQVELLPRTMCFDTTMPCSGPDFSYSYSTLYLAHILHVNRVDPPILFTIYIISYYVLYNGLVFMYWFTF
jgi:hypothetical protein